MKFDICMMNPPYPHKTQHIDQHMVMDVNKIVRQNVAIYPGNKWFMRTKMANTNATSGHLEGIDLLDVNVYFDTWAQFRWVGIYNYYNDKKFDRTWVKLYEEDEYRFYGGDKYEDRKLAYSCAIFPKNLKMLIDKTTPLYKEMMEKYGTMIEDRDGRIYEERYISYRKAFVENDSSNNKSIRSNEIAKYYLKNNTYKYCVYKSSSNNHWGQCKEYKGEDPDKFVKGQLFWFTDNERIKNNLIYWMNSKIVFLWARFYFRQYLVCCFCNLRFIPAAPFDMDENEFKKWVDNICNITDEEINNII